MGVRARQTIENKAEENEKAKQRMMGVRARQTIENKSEENDKAKQRRRKLEIKRKNGNAKN